MNNCKTKGTAICCKHEQTDGITSSKVSYRFDLESPSICYYQRSAKCNEIFAGTKMGILDRKFGQLISLSVVDDDTERLGGPPIVIVKKFAWQNQY